MPTIAVFGNSSVLPATASYAEGVRFGRRLAEAGYVVATGGYGGLMEAVSLGAREAGGQTIGVTVPNVFPERGAANIHVIEEQQAASLMDRIGKLIEESDGVIALEGSIGTFTELMAAWNLAFVARFSGASPKPIIAVGSGWAKLIEKLADELKTDASFVTCVSTVGDALGALERQLQG
jgi:uncharacterized protein (TIGR00725 family)